MSENPSDEKKYLLEEFKALRKEIIERRKRQFQLIVIIVTISSAILGWGFQSRKYEVFFFIFLPTIPLGILSLSFSANIMRISSYIQHSIEPKLGMGFEKFISNLKHIGKHHTWYTTSFILLILSFQVTASALYLYYYDKTKSCGYFGIIGIAFSVIFAILLGGANSSIHLYNYQKIEKLKRNVS